MMGTKYLYIKLSYHGDGCVPEFGRSISLQAYNDEFGIHAEDPEAQDIWRKVIELRRPAMDNESLEKAFKAYAEGLVRQIILALDDFAKVPTERG